MAGPTSAPPSYIFHRMRAPRYLSKGPRLLIPLVRRDGDECVSTHHPHTSSSPLSLFPVLIQSFRSRPLLDAEKVFRSQASSYTSAMECSDDGDSAVASSRSEHFP